MLVADGRGDARAGHHAELDGGHADAAGRAVHEQALADGQPGLGEERVVGGGEDLGDAARRGPVELLRDRHRGALVDDRVLGLAAAGDQRHHAVAGLEAPDAAAAGDDLARELEARDVGRDARAAADSGRRACMMSAPLRPAARTRTSNWPSWGSGSGRSATSIRPSTIVAARMLARVLPVRPWRSARDIG